SCFKAPNPWPDWLDGLACLCPTLSSCLCPCSLNGSATAPCPAASSWRKEISTGSSSLSASGSATSRRSKSDGQLVRSFCCYVFLFTVNVLDDVKAKLFLIIKGCVFPGEEAAEALFPFSSLVVKKEQDEGRCFPQVLGVLGHTQIPIRLPVGKQALESVGPAQKRKKKKAHPDCWLNLELVCSCRGQFLHCRVSKGSDVDRGRRLRDRLKQNPELMPPGSCLVARAGYPLTAQILTPYTQSNGPDQELFNQTLEEHCQILDQAVSSLKVRFKRLTYLDIGNYDRARTVVYTACVLHNVFVQMGQELQGESETESTVTVEEEEQEEDEEGVQRRDVVADLLLTNGNSGRT
ncbi:hypothetical protein XENOCAPTIV_005700, partial [Xenoophorus captivus]